ncbi:MAG: formate dehydrogenase accessory sulfurtransferase FdhD [Chloroflexota bacterium]|nr:formate dehydrogenase accessory sulfurtransferase FdhD [Chloroflexota bacterium]
MHWDKLKILKIVDGERVSQMDTVIREAEIVMRVDERLYRRFYCLAERIEELALGYLFDEGVALPGDIDVAAEGHNVSVTRKCGAKTHKPAAIDSELRLTYDDVLALVDEMNDNCPMFSSTGGTHVVGIVCGDERFFVEDISRHCAIDKAIGFAVKNGFDLSQCILVTSCRQTVSAMSKAVNAGIPIVVTIAAPTTMAVTEAINYGVTLVGFARGRKFNVYSHPHRIVTGSR